MLMRTEVEHLLDRLCTSLGYCLPPDVREQLAAAAPTDIDGFTAAVLEGEGLDPTADREQYRQVRAVVAEGLGAARLDSN